MLLVLNAGSSSLKYSLYADDSDALTRIQHGSIEELSTAARFVAFDADGQRLHEQRCGTLSAEQAAQHLLDFLDRQAIELTVAAHRIVHGGARFTEPVVIDDAVLAGLEELIPLAPLHQPHNIAPIRALRALRPALPQVACFDTAFHRTMPEVAQRFALPEALTAKGIRRFGFHGLSYEYIASVLPDLDPRAAAGRTVVAHLGNGASLCALRGGQSVATTMGFTPLDGLPMGTRCGSLDPGALLYIVQTLAMPPAEVERLLYHDSGLLGVSGVSSDMRKLIKSKDPRARMAVDLFVYRIGCELGSMCAALGGLDALVFTGGIGQHQAELRARVCRDAHWLGIRLDMQANADNARAISTDQSQARVWCIPTDEEKIIAQHAKRVLT